MVIGPAQGFGDSAPDRCGGRLGPEKHTPHVVVHTDYVMTGIPKMQRGFRPEEPVTITTLIQNAPSDRTEGDDRVRRWTCQREPLTKNPIGGPPLVAQSEQYLEEG